MLLSSKLAPCGYLTPSCVLQQQGSLGVRGPLNPPAKRPLDSRCSTTGQLLRVNSSADADTADQEALQERLEREKHTRISLDDFYDDVRGLQQLWFA